MRAELNLWEGADRVELRRLSTMRTRYFQKSNQALVTRLIDEPVKLELDHRVKLYQFYVELYVKGIALYLGITSVLLKFAVDSTSYREVFCVAGLACAFAILIPLFFAYQHERTLRADFDRLAKASGINAISTSPLLYLSHATTCFWFIIFMGWFYVLLWL